MKGEWGREGEGRQKDYYPHWRYDNLAAIWQPICSTIGTEVSFDSGPILPRLQMISLFSCSWLPFHINLQCILKTF